MRLNKTLKTMLYLRDRKHCIHAQHSLRKKPKGNQVWFQENTYMIKVPKHWRKKVLTTIFPSRIFLLTYRRLKIYITSRRQTFQEMRISRVRCVGKTYVLIIYVSIRKRAFTRSSPENETIQEGMKFTVFTFTARLNYVLYMQCAFGSNGWQCGGVDEGVGLVVDVINP